MKVTIERVEDEIRLYVESENGLEAFALDEFLRQTGVPVLIGRMTLGGGQSGIPKKITATFGPPTSNPEARKRGGKTR